MAAEVPAVKLVFLQNSFCSQAERKKKGKVATQQITTSIGQNCSSSAPSSAGKIECLSFSNVVTTDRQGTIVQECLVKPTSGVCTILLIICMSVSMYYFDKEIKFQKEVTKNQQIFLNGGQVNNVEYRM